jgi:hypothetical protein
MYNNIGFADMRETSDESSTMKRIFEMQEQETISDEQVQRVLAPVLEMIRQGKFSKRNRMWRRIRKIAVGFATCISIAAFAFVAPQMWVDISPAEIPLVSTPFATSSLSGVVTLEGKGVNGVVLTLWNSDSGTGTVVISDISGGYSFDEISAGDYRLEMTPPSGMELENGSGGFYLTVTDGEVLHDVAIRLCAREDDI